MGSFIESLIGKWKRDKNVTKMLTCWFEDLDNPYSEVLLLMENLPGFDNCCTNSLPLQVLIQFSKWIVPYQKHFQYCLTRAIKHEAFNIFSEPFNVDVRIIGAKTYNLNSNYKYSFEGDLNEMYDRKLYKKVGEWVAILDLDCFNPEDFLMPLLLTRKEKIVFSIISLAPTYETEFAEFLDDILGDSSILDDFISDQNLERPNIGKWNLAKLISKTIRKLVDNYDHVPNLKFQDDIKTISFLGNEYKREKLSGQGFYERMKEICCHQTDDGDRLKGALLTFLKRNGLNEEYTFWDDKFYSNVTGVHPRSNQEPSGDVFLANAPYHTLDKRIKKIFVSNFQDMERCANEISKEKVIGLDTETKSTSGLPNMLALIQIATLDNVYLFDTLSLLNHVAGWNTMIKKVFKNKNIIKLVFGSHSDTAAFTTYPPLSKVELKGESYIDLLMLWMSLKRKEKVCFPFNAEDNTSVNGLTKLVQLCLGRPLSKLEQLSNWERRPLRKAQETYAALDAHCLLEVLQVLTNICWEQNIRIEHICPKISTIYVELSYCSHCLKTNHTVFTCVKRKPAQTKIQNEFDAILDNLDECVNACNNESYSDILSEIDCYVCHSLQNTFSRCFIMSETLQEIHGVIVDVNNVKSILSRYCPGYGQIIYLLNEVLDHFDNVEKIVRNIRNQVDQIQRSNKYKTPFMMCTYCFEIGHLDIKCSELERDLETIQNALSVEEDSDFSDEMY